jgi:hypothetical protein
LNGTVNDFVLVGGTLPVAETGAVEYRDETAVCSIVENIVGLIAANFTDENVAPMNRAAMSLEVDRACGLQRHLSFTPETRIGFACVIRHITSR